MLRTKSVIVKKGRFIAVKKTERKRTSLLASLGEFNRPVRVRPVRVLRREWWAIASEDTWPGMVMDLRRLGFEAMALGDEVLVREGGPMYETRMEGPAAPEGLKPFPIIHPTIQIRKESAYPSNFADLSYLDDYNDDAYEEEDDSLEPEDLDNE